MLSHLLIKNYALIEQLEMNVRVLNSGLKAARGENETLRKAAGVQSIYGGGGVPMDHVVLNMKMANELGMIREALRRLNTRVNAASHAAPSLPASDAQGGCDD